MIEISDETNELLETGGGLIFARKFLDHGEDFLIMNADILTDLNINALVEYHKKIKDFATLAVSDRESSRKLIFNDDLVLRGWLNVQTGEQRLAIPQLLALGGDKGKFASRQGVSYSNHDFSS